jgi:hypothetical protein
MHGASLYSAHMPCIVVLKHTDNHIFTLNVTIYHKHSFLWNKENNLNCMFIITCFFWGGGGEGPRSRCYVRTAAMRLIVQPCDENEDYQFFFAFPSNGAPVELNWQGKTEVLGGKNLSQCHFVHHKFHMDTRDRTRASAVGGRRLTAWTMARPSLGLLRNKWEKWLSTVWQVVTSSTKETPEAWRCSELPHRVAGDHLWYRTVS